MSGRTLFCFPHAGGVSAEYRSWVGRFGRRAVRPVSYPGRETRYAEPLLTSVDELAAFAERLVPADHAVALFGHSLGALVAFELAHRLESSGRPVAALIVAGQSAPGSRERTSTIHQLEQKPFLDELRKLGGMDPVVEAEPDLLELVLPRIRADVRAAETYAHVERRALECPVLALGGVDDDEITPHHIESWSASTVGPFQSRMFDGTHFFVRERTDAVIESIEAFLGEVAPLR